MVLFTFTYDIETEDGLILGEATSRCHGTLLTEKIVLTALHCCRPAQIEGVEGEGHQNLNINTNKLAHIKEATVEAGRLLLSANNLITVPQNRELS